MTSNSGQSSRVEVATATVDIFTVKGRVFAEVASRFDMEAKIMRAAGELPPFPVKTGIMRFTPEDARKALLHNGGNRPIRLNHVQSIATMMQMGHWKLAQPILFNEDGDLLDGQHRLYAIMHSGQTIDTTVMVVPNQPDLFAVIDAGVGRSSADALSTAGFEVPKPVAGGARLVYLYEHGQLGPIKQPKTRKLQNLEVVAYVRAHPELVDAAKEAIEDYPIPTAMIGNKGVATAFVHLVNTTFEEGVLHDFFNTMGLNLDLPPDHPIAALRKRFNESEAGREARLSGPQRLALLIQAFLMESAGEKVPRKDLAKGLTMKHTDRFPRIEEAVKEPEAV